MEIPAHVTLGTLRGRFSDTKLHDDIQEAVEHDIGRYTKALGLRFVFTADLVDCHDEMTIGHFRQLARLGVTKILIEEEGGGELVGA